MKRQQKINQIRRLWVNPTYEKANLEDLNLKQKIYLGILLSGPVSNNNVYGPFTKRPLFSIENQVCKAINELLLDVKAIRIHSYTMDNFSNNGLEVVNVNKMEFCLNINTQENREIELQQIANGNIKINEQNKVDIWRWIASQEVINYLYFTLNKLGLNSYSTNEDKIQDYVAEMLDIYSVKQCFHIISSSVRKAMMQYKCGNITKKYASNLAIYNCRNYAKNAKENGWEISEYNWPINLKKSLAVEYIFEKLLKIGDLGYSRCPTKDVLHQPIYF